MNKDYYIYCHTLLFNNKKYIGMTKMKPNLRWRKQGQGYKANMDFYEAILKYGWNNFKHEILYENLTKEEAKQKEIELIALYKTQDEKYGFNLTGGGTGGYKPCAKTLLKMKKSAMGNKSSLGHKNTQEMKQNMSKLKKQFWSNEENRKKQSIANGWQKKKVAKIDKNTNEVICIYNSIAEAGNKNKTKKSNIGSCCNGKRKTAYGYKWEFVKEVMPCQK